MRVLVLIYFLSCFSIFISCTKTQDNNLYPSKDIVIKTHSDWTKTHYPQRIKEFKRKPLQKNDVVFLGNSITEQGGNWSEKLNIPNIKNRGISGDTTEGILYRINEVIYSKPSKVFLLIGINDLYSNKVSVNIIHKNIITIVNKIVSENHRTKIFVNTILPTSDDKLIDKIIELNKLLQKSERTAPYKLINIYSLFVTKNKKINMKYSTDGVHLNKQGYSIWCEKLKQHF
ncbi:GDSL-type esterase/lipase family protein [Polaribacter marinivivus]|uniref:GDSL-type esterase/lipase family protein n=1 Tax=Polaribacter marinivivus TaxID=1524260 RepID=UPI003D3285C2